MHRPATIASARRVLLVGLTLWGVGVQIIEGLAAVGAVLTAVTVIGLWWKLGPHDRRGPNPGPTPALHPTPLPEGEGVLRAWWPLFAYVIWGLAVTLPVSFAFTGALARHLDWLLLPFAGGAVTLLEPRQRRVLAGVVFGVFLLSCLTAGLQHYGLWPTLEQMRARGIPFLHFKRVYEAVPNTDGRFMGGGLLAHRLRFAHVSGILVLWALVLGLNAQGRRRLLLLAVATLGALSVLAFPFARSGFGALLIGAASIALFDRARRKQAFIGALVALVLGASVFALHAPLRTRMLGALTLQGAGDRHHLLGAGLTALKGHLLTGTGVGQFRAADFASPDASHHVRHHQGKAHNQLLTTAAETGVIGLGLFLLLLVHLVRRMPRGTVTGTAGLAVFVFWMVLSLAHDPTHHAEVSLALMLGLGFGTARPPSA